MAFMPGISVTTRTKSRREGRKRLPVKGFAQKLKCSPTAPSATTELGKKCLRNMLLFSLQSFIFGLEG
jgi:hypothetical protein